MQRFKHTLLSLNCDGRYGFGLALVWVLLLAPALGGSAWRDALRYERGAVLAGQAWRLLTAHLVHLSPQHAVLNALGATLLWALFARDVRPLHWLAVVLGSAVAVDTGLLLLQPQLHWYVGASGVLHGVMAAGTVTQLRRADPVSALLAVLLLGKIAWEQHAGALPLVPSGSVVISAHAYGAAGGALVALVLLRNRYNAA